MKQILLFTTALLIATNLAFSQGAAINSTGAKADSSAGLDISFSNKGFLIPRLTTAQRNTIVSPAEGLQIYNTDNKCFEFYSGAWHTMACACVSAPVVPVVGIHIPAQTQITWSWNMVYGASGYKWNAVNNYGTATDNGSGISYNQTGLNCNTSYSLYVWAYNACGNSAALQLTEATSACPQTVFDYTGAEQYFNVPVGVNTITVKAWGGGGSGGGSSGNPPAKGGGAGFIQSDISVTAGEQLIIIAGGGGQTAACGGGGGGGRSAVKRGGTELITAAGGGGSGAWEGPGGAGGGSAGSDGTGAYPGLGGTTSSGGAGGGGPYAGYAGSAFAGGNTYDNGCGTGGYGGGGTGGFYGGGGGGGAGWYGGGGGGAVSNNAGGGGGSSYSTGTNTITVGGSGTQPGQTSDPDYAAPVGVGGNAAVSGGNGRVVISW